MSHLMLLVTIAYNITGVEYIKPFKLILMIVSLTLFESSVLRRVEWCHLWHDAGAGAVHEGVALDAGAVVEGLRLAGAVHRLIPRAGVAAQRVLRPGRPQLRAQAAAGVTFALRYFTSEINLK